MATAATEIDLTAGEPEAMETKVLPKPATTPASSKKRKRTDDDDDYNPDEDSGNEDGDDFLGIERPAKKRRSAASSNDGDDGEEDDEDPDLEDEKPFMCDYKGCERRYKSRASMRAHQREKHEKPQSEQKAKKKVSAAETKRKKEEALRVRAEKEEAFQALDDDGKLHAFLECWDELYVLRDESQQAKLQKEHDEQAATANAEAQAGQIRHVISAQLKKSMVYTNGSLMHKAVKIPVTLPNVSKAAFLILVGDALPKKERHLSSLALDVTSNNIGSILGGDFSKGLRYGAVLTLVYPMKLTLKGGTLHLNSSYHMEK